MKTFSLLVLIASFASCASICADDSDSGATQPAQAPWESLFDGKSFEHWRGYGQEAMPAGWVIEEGTMYAKESGRGMDIVTRKSYTSFEFECEWRVGPNGNSGIIWHVDESAGDYPWMTGPEYQILDDVAHTGGSATKNSAGSSYDVYVPTQWVTRPAGTWNQTRIVVSGKHVQHHLNGTLIVEYEKGSADWVKRVAGSKWSRWPAYGTTDTGHLAIQGDHGTVWYRNLRVREL
ncbi:MAG: DUF1080 domain-containing protein [bacterium]|nr:DUF1080 domain-containing protein [bacterium]